MQKSKTPNIVSVSWGDHLIFGEGDGRLETVPALRRRIQNWKSDLGAGIVHWRCTRNRISGKYFQGRGYRHFYRSRTRAIQWDDLHEVSRLAHDFDMKIFLYVTLFDEGWPLLPKNVRQVSYHNKMHCQHVTWQSDFSRHHPQYAMLDRIRNRRQWGVLCLAYPEVRRHFIRRYQRLLAAGSFDGLFLCLRSQSRPADFADQFGFNQPVRDDFLKRYGKDIWQEDFEIADWRHLLGEYLTIFLVDLKNSLKDSRTRLAVGVPRGQILGPPFGNTTLQWKTWVEQEIVDHLVIDQNSSNCPSMWHDLWPMHRGYGYRQNYLDGFNMKPLQEDLTSDYQPVFQSSNTRLYLARQWQPRSPTEEKSLQEHPGVAGLVFSSFRHDNPGPVQRNDWTL
jgi:hypothetical protein